MRVGVFMSIRVSTHIDEATMKQFDKICESIGTTPANAMSMFIKGVINHNGIPFSLTTAPSKTTETAVRPPFRFGSMKGKVWMADDFDAPLDDFKEYM